MAPPRRAASKPKPKPKSPSKPPSKSKPKPKPPSKPEPKPPLKSKPAARVSTHPPKIRTAATLALIERLRAICLALPGVVEQEAWAEPTWRVGGRLFAMCDTYHHGSAHLSVHLAAPPGAQAALIDAEPARFFRPPYTGGKGWIAVVLDTGPDWDMVASLVATAHATIGARAPGRRRS